MYTIALLALFGNAPDDVSVAVAVELAKLRLKATCKQSLQVQPAEVRQRPFPRSRVIPRTAAPSAASTSTESAVPDPFQGAIRIPVRMGTLGSTNCSA